MGSIWFLTNTFMYIPFCLWVAIPLVVSKEVLSFKENTVKSMLTYEFKCDQIFRAPCNCYMI